MNRYSRLIMFLALIWASSAQAQPTWPVEEPVQSVADVSVLSASEAMGESVLDLTHRSSVRVVRMRQHNPLRAARIFSYLRVAQWQALQRAGQAQLAPTGQMALMNTTLAQTAAWLLPQEAQAQWQGPALLGEQSLQPALREQVRQLSQQASSQLLQRSLHDGADARRRPLAKPVWQAGLWARTPPLFAEQPTEPQAPQWQVWCAGTDGLHPPPPPPYGSAQWVADMREVMELRAQLNAAKKAAAERWNLDAGSITPPGVWNALVLDHLARKPLPLHKHHELLARLNMAMHDALVAAWRVKVQYWTERPVSAIQREWQPDFLPWVITPPFPGYVSGHATVSGAAAAVLVQLLPEAASRWQALAEEAAMSRLWGGIHPRYDNDAGLELGRRVGARCLEVKAPALTPAQGSSQ